MRGKLLLWGMIILSALLLCSCTEIIESPADELTLYDWRGEAENGTVISLSFQQDNAVLSIENEELSLTLYGMCIVSDDRMTLCDEESGMNYPFGYRLYGDRVEICCNGSTLSLEKVLPE